MRRVVRCGLLAIVAAAALAVGGATARAQGWNLSFGAGYGGYGGYGSPSGYGPQTSFYGGYGSPWGGVPRWSYRPPVYPPTVYLPPPSFQYRYGYRPQYFRPGLPYGGCHRW